MMAADSSKSECCVYYHSFPHRLAFSDIQLSALHVVVEMSDDTAA